MNPLILKRFKDLKNSLIPKKVFNFNQEFITYYPTDISVSKLAKQDLTLEPLKLRDFAFDVKRDKEIHLAARNKPVRVSVKFGPLKPPVKENSKKKKKKR